MTNPTASKPFHRLLLTGAGGGLGTMLRERIKPWTDIVRASDVRAIAPAGAGEEVVRCDLADRAAVYDLLDGVDAVLHFGGVSVEDTFETIMQANILGLHHLYEAVHKRGIKRVIYASSSHVVGYYPTTEVIDAAAPLRPDGMYGVSKCFGEALSRYYYDRFGIETVCLRIGSSFDEPRNARMMVTFLATRRPGRTGALRLVRRPRRPHHHVRRVGQPGALVGQQRGRPSGLPAGAQLARVRWTLSGHRHVGGWRRRHGRVPGRAVFDGGADLQGLVNGLFGGIDGPAQCAGLFLL